jgi:hypothetical protein
VEVITVESQAYRKLMSKFIAAHQEKEKFVVIAANQIKNQLLI